MAGWQNGGRHGGVSAKHKQTFYRHQMAGSSGRRQYRRIEMPWRHRRSQMARWQNGRRHGGTRLQAPNGKCYLSTSQANWGPPKQSAGLNSTSVLRLIRIHQYQNKLSSKSPLQKIAAESAAASLWRDLFPLCGRAVARRAEEVFRPGRRVPLPQPAPITNL